MDLVHIVYGPASFSIVPKPPKTSLQLRIPDELESYCGSVMLTREDSSVCWWDSSVCWGTVVPRKSGPLVSANIRVWNTVVSGYPGCLHSKNSGNNQHHQKGSGPSLRLKMYGSGFEALDGPCTPSLKYARNVEVRPKLHFCSFSSIFSVRLSTLCPGKSESR